MQADSFTPLLKYSWFSCGYVEARAGRFRNLQEIIFDVQTNGCELCGIPAFMKCGYCEKHLCFSLFFTEYHFHEQFHFYLHCEFAVVTIQFALHYYYITYIIYYYLHYITVGIQNVTNVYCLFLPVTCPLCHFIPICKMYYYYLFYCSSTCFYSYIYHCFSLMILTIKMFNIAKRIVS